MNQAGMWLVVKPTVGLPLFIGGVAVTSLIVHAAILSHTTWYPGFLQGAAKARVSAVELAPPGVAPKAAAPVASAQ